MTACLVHITTQVRNRTMYSCSEALARERLNQAERNSANHRRSQEARDARRADRLARRALAAAARHSRRKDRAGDYGLAR